MHHCVKVANPAGLVPLPPIEGVRLAAGGAKHPPRGFRGIPPDTPLVTFVVKRKSPGCRAWQGHALAERPLKGRAEGQRPSHIRGMQGPCPCSSSPGETQSPLHLYPETPQKLHADVQPLLWFYQFFALLGKTKRPIGHLSYGGKSVCFCYFLL